MKEIEVEKSKSYKRFTWNDKSINALLDAYGKIIDLIKNLIFKNMQFFS